MRAERVRRLFRGLSHACRSSEAVLKTQIVQMESAAVKQDLRMRNSCNMYRVARSSSDFAALFKNILFENGKAVPYFSKQP